MEAGVSTNDQPIRGTIVVRGIRYPHFNEADTIRYALILETDGRLKLCENMVSVDELCVAMVFRPQRYGMPPFRLLYLAAPVDVLQEIASLTDQEITERGTSLVGNADPSERDRLIVLADGTSGIFHIATE